MGLCTVTSRLSFQPTSTDTAIIISRNIRNRSGHRTYPCLGKWNYALRLQVRKCDVCMFLCIFATLQGRRAVCWRVTQFEQVLCHGLWVDFDAVCVFLRMDCPFRIAKEFLFPLPDGAIFLAKLQTKIAKSPEIGRKVCAHHFVQIAEGFEKIPLQQFRADNADVHLYIFFRTSLYSADSKCQILYRQSKNGSILNKILRTKSHTGSKFCKTSLALLYT